MSGEQEPPRPSLAAYEEVYVGPLPCLLLIQVCFVLHHQSKVFQKLVDAKKEKMDYSQLMALQNEIENLTNFFSFLLMLMGLN